MESCGGENESRGGENCKLFIFNRFLFSNIKILLERELG